jgi:hypothetical protein
MGNLEEAWQEALTKGREIMAEQGELGEMEQQEFDDLMDRLQREVPSLIGFDDSQFEHLTDTLFGELPEREYPND